MEEKHVYYYSNFDEYMRQEEPSVRESAANWNIATGLQAVDHLRPSPYLYEVARRNIEGAITVEESCSLINTYYQSRAGRTPTTEGAEEADRVSANIVRILSTKTFSFNANGFLSLHRRIFEGVFSHAGKMRDYDISKREWVLNGDSVSYLNWEDLRLALDFDMQQEKDFHYKGLSEDEIVRRLTKFVAGLWQIHPFREGNTRTTAVFAVQYLRSVGFDVDNTMFAKHSWYFRNALVRANYKNVRLGIEYTPVYLERFFRNLLFEDEWDLKNRYLHIDPPEEWRHQPNKKEMGQPQDNLLSAGQVRMKSGISTGQVCEGSETPSSDICQLIQVIGNKNVSIKEMMSAMRLRGRDNFLTRYLYPAMSRGYVAMLYPDSPRHPRQKYMLTDSGRQVCVKKC